MKVIDEIKVDSKAFFRYAEKSVIRSKIGPFNLNWKPLQIVTSFKYLGLSFNFNGKFNAGVKELKEQGRRAMFALLKKCRHLELPISVQFELFNSLVRPILTYGSEIWGYNCVNIIESLHLEFCKYVLHMKKEHTQLFRIWRIGTIPVIHTCQ